MLQYCNLRACNHAPFLAHPFYGILWRVIHLRRLRANDFKQLRAIDLVLPQRGSILVQGPNEAGKSTLFEAVFVALFGRPLDGKRLDDCIRHGAEEAYLRLEVALPGGREMAVTRRLRRTRSVYLLEIAGPEGEVEELRGAAVIGPRIEAELGFDGDAMLDTCFVEQKKLDKLEGMSLRDRERSLLKLLNLDRMQRLADDLRVSRDDEVRLERLRTRRDLADVQTRLPDLREALKAAGRTLARAEARDALEGAVAERESLTTLAAEAGAASARATALAESARAAEEAGAALRAVGEGRTALERAAEADAALAAAAAAATAARDAATALAGVTRRGLLLKRLRDRLACIERLEAEREAREEARLTAEARLQELAQLREQLNDTRRELVDARGALRDAERDLEELGGDLSAFDVREALADWRDGHVRLASLEDPAPAIAARRESRADVLSRARLQLAGLAVTALLSLGGGQMLRGSAGVPGAVTVGMTVFGLLALLLLATRSYGAWRRLDALTAELARLEGEASVLQERRAALGERVGRAETRLGELRAGVPAGLDRAAESVQALNARIAGRGRGDVEHAKEAAARARAESAAAVALLGPREAQLQQAAGPREAGETLAARDAAAARAARLARFLERRRPQLEDAATAAGIELETGALDLALGGLRAELQSLRRQAAAVGEHEATAARHAEARARHRSTAREAWTRVPATHRAAIEAGGEDGPAIPSRPLPPVAAWDGLGARLRATFEAAGGQAVRRAHDEASRAAAGLEARHAQSLERWERGLSDLLRRIAGLEGAPGPAAALGAVDPAAIEAPTPEQLADAAAALTDQLPPRATTEALAARRERAQRELDVADYRRAQLEDALDLRGEVLDLEACAAAVAETERGHAVQRRARAMLEQAGRRVVQAVMPSTIEHMRRLLPTLTAGRYFDAQLSEDYRIEVYDERAGDWLRKTLFSGGTRDQFSLALRLAFALATLPEERGVAPGFLFLDEPLGAFDDARARALIALLTEGEVAESFDQVFLISHVRVDPALFDHRIELEDGAVAASTLPPPPETQLDPESEGVEEARPELAG